MDLQVDFLDTHQNIGLCGTWVERFGRGASTIGKYPKSHEEVKAYTLFDCPLAHPTVMFRRALFLENNLTYDGSYYPTEDYELWSRAIECFSVVNLPKILLKYRMHSGSMTGSDWQEMDDQAARVAEKQLEMLGFDVSNDQLRFHRNIGRGSSVRLKSMAEMRNGEAWLLRLKEKNNQAGRYNEEAFSKTLSLIWFQLCMNNSWLGFGILRCFSKSLLFEDSPAKMQNMVALVTSIIKNRLFAFK